MNVEGLTNKQLLRKALQWMVDETELDGRPSAEAVAYAKAALSEVDQSKRPPNWLRAKPE